MLNDYVIITIYVNNLLLFGKLLRKIKEVKALIAGRFQVKNLREASIYLGIHILKDHKN